MASNSSSLARSTHLINGSPMANTFSARAFSDKAGPISRSRSPILVHGKDLPSRPPMPTWLVCPATCPNRRAILKTFAVKANQGEKAEVLEVRVPPMANRQRMLIAIDKPAKDAPPAKLFVDYLALEGPLDTRPASHARLLATSAGKSQAEQTREVLSRFLRRAFRRPPTADELTRSIKLAETAIAGGEKWETGIQLAMQGALCSPKFLFRVEADDCAKQPRGQGGR